MTTQEILDLNIKIIADYESYDINLIWINKRSFFAYLSILSFCVKNRCKIIGIGYKPFDSTKQYQDFSIKQMVDGGFLVEYLG